jgi:uncharacterized protein (DUF169 family)
MPSFEKINEIGKSIRGSLSLRTYPLGIKFCKSAEETEKAIAEAKARRPLTAFNVRMSVCQVVNIARTHRWTLGMTFEDSWCIGGSLAMGLLDELPEYLYTDVQYVKFHFKDAEAAKAVLEVLEKRYLPLKSSYAVLVGPLERIKFDPDVCLIYGTPTQIAKIAKAFTWWGIVPEMKFVGQAACSSISNAYLTGKPQISIPCSGEVLLGRTEEDEISIAFPIKDLDKLLSGLEGTNFIFPYPPAKFSLYEPRVPEVYRISYKDYMEWKAKRAKS